MLSRIILLFFFSTFVLYAIDGAVSVHLVEKERRFISEEVVVKVDLRSTAFSIKDARIGLENSDDYIVIAPKSAIALETVDINDTQWQVVHYEYKIYPLHAGKIVITPIDITFKASMGYGQPDNNFTFLSDALILEVQVPEGVKKGDFVLSTESYSLESDISPKISETNSTKIKVGDAIEIKVTQEAQNVPDLLLRPFTFTKNEHFKIYRDEPLLKTEVLGSNTIATRRDSFTLVAFKEGNVSISSQTFIWWDPVNQVLHKEQTKALDFIVLPNPKHLVSDLKDDEPKKQQSWAYAIIFGLLLILLVYRLYPYIKIRKEQHKLAYMQSEKGRFEQLMLTLKGDDMTKSYTDLYHWLQIASPALSKGGFRAIVEVQPSFENSLQVFEKVLAGHEEVFDKVTFRNELEKFREVLLKESQFKEQGLPKEINPK